MTLEKLSKTDVHFNHDHEFHQVAELEKWSALAGKWFKLHGENLRPKFLAKWSGPNGKFGKEGRFQKEIKKLEKSFHRKCSNKKVLHGSVGKEDVSAQEVKFLNETSFGNQTFKEEEESTAIDLTRKRRSDQNLKHIHNSGDRMKHIIHNIEEWVETTLSTCPKTDNIIKRWAGFVRRWEGEIEKNPIFQEEIESEKRYFRSQGSGDEGCGVIFSEFGLHGRQLPLYDAAVNPNHGYDDLGETQFGNDQLMSMKPFPGMRKPVFESFMMKQSFIDLNNLM